MTSLQELNKDIGRCPGCPLKESRTRVVPGEGSPQSKIMFIGEAPGFHEDQQGRPFVGPAGQFLDQLLSLMGLRREEVYITNIIKCRPPNNRDPLPNEIQACSEWLEQQITIIQPKIIVTLGRYSLARFLPDQAIGKVHGKAIRRDGRIYFPMYHPAAALHQGSLRQVIEEDARKVSALLKETDKVIVEENEAAQQLSLF